MTTLNTLICTPLAVGLNTWASLPLFVPMFSALAVTTGVPVNGVSKVTW
jgi:hypothetical protein